MLKKVGILILCVSGLFVTPAFAAIADSVVVPGDLRISGNGNGLVFSDGSMQFSATLQGQQGIQVIPVAVLAIRDTPVIPVLLVELLLRGPLDIVVIPDQQDLQDLPDLLAIPDTQAELVIQGIQDHL